MRTRWLAPAVAVVLLTAACGGGDQPDPAASSRSTTTTTSTTTTATCTPTPTPCPTTPTPPATTTPSPPRTTAAPTTPPPATAPSTALPDALEGRVLTKVPTSAKVVALTFDGGAGSQGAPSILATLRDSDVAASFFATGKFATANPGITGQMAAIGPVGNHSWSHPEFPELSETAIDQELSSAAAAIRAATGKDPRPFFRFPFGAYDSRTLALVNEEGYGAIGWTTDSLGWKGTSGGMTVDTVVQRVLAGMTPGQIVLMHVGANPDDGTTLDAAALPRIIAGYRAAGYGFVTLDVLR